MSETVLCSLLGIRAPHSWHCVQDDSVCITHDDPIRPIWKHAEADAHLDVGVNHAHLSPGRHEGTWFASVIEEHQAAAMRARCPTSQHRAVLTHQDERGGSYLALLRRLSLGLPRLTDPQGKHGHKDGRDAGDQGDLRRSEVTGGKVRTGHDNLRAERAGASAQH